MSKTLEQFFEMINLEKIIDPIEKHLEEHCNNVIFIKANIGEASLEKMSLLAADNNIYPTILTSFRTNSPYYPVEDSFIRLHVEESLKELWIRLHVTRHSKCRVLYRKRPPTFEDLKYSYFQ